MKQGMRPWACTSVPLACVSCLANRLQLHHNTPKLQSTCATKAPALPSTAPMHPCCGLCILVHHASPQCGCAVCRSLRPSLPPCAPAGCAPVPDSARPRCAGQRGVGAPACAPGNHGAVPEAPAEAAGGERGRVMEDVESGDWRWGWGWRRYGCVCVLECSYVSYRSQHICGAVCTRLRASCGHSHLDPSLHHHHNSQRPVTH